MPGKSEIDAVLEGLILTQPPVAGGGRDDRILGPTRHASYPR
jgi:hypothetical protein